MKLKLLLALVIISTITVPCFSETNKAIEKSKNFYGNLDSYKASFTSQFYGQGENTIKGEIYYKYPNLLRIEAKQLLFGDERKMLIILDGAHYYNEIVTTAKGDREIRKADGRIIHIKKGELETSVMLFREDLQDISMEILKKTLKKLKKEDLTWYLNSFQPGFYSKNPHFAFDTFMEYYLLKNSTKNHFEAELTTLSDVNTLPLLVKCYFNESGMITKIETFDKDSQKKAEISYENLKINLAIKDSLFNYTIPDNAFVIDHVADIKQLKQK